MAKRYHFVQVDVFTDQPFGGNQLAVFTDARGLNAGEMQLLAREMNYSESTFVLPPEIPTALRRVRIFTPAKEMPLAGHPTVGTTFVLAQQGQIALREPAIEIVLQLGIGPVPITIEVKNGAPDFVWMTQREPSFGVVRDDRRQVAEALGITVEDIHPAWPLQPISTGVPFLFVPLRSLGAAERCRPNVSALVRLFARGEADGVYVFTTETASPAASIHGRMFALHALEIPEDPATGSAAAPLGAYVARYNILPRAAEMRFVCEQGIEMGRPSQIHVEVRGAGEEIAGLRIGGRAVIVGEGEIFWD
ncbi:MAG TPA: PhzF family phenazine biosynthesis protein [Anaerolineae bacterium]|nr:PhzF family phenazine biosynthesis protein [Anaerolineae bacterium]